mmetsp:Transcript_41649/g.69288  ORF Transcript_41649/g.69288 Transcript_41649/m.69288 type:complete len:226 (+) Transcript_41649:941-1618(+)
MITRFREIVAKPRADRRGGSYAPSHSLSPSGSPQCEQPSGAEAGQVLHSHSGGKHSLGTRQDARNPKPLSFPREGRKQGVGEHHDDRRRSRADRPPQHHPHVGRRLAGTSSTRCPNVFTRKGKMPTRKPPGHIHSGARRVPRARCTGPQNAPSAFVSPSDTGKRPTVKERTKRHGFQAERTGPVVWTEPPPAAAHANGPSCSCCMLAPLSLPSRAPSAEADWAGR